MIGFIIKSAEVIAKASGKNPALSMLVVFLLYAGFNGIEAMIETLIWGERFEHWFDPLFMLAFMAYACLTVWVCALLRGVDDD